MNRIETDRFVIRNFQVDDWHDLHEMIAQYQASEYAQYDHAWPTSIDEIKGVTKWFVEGERYLAVCLQATGKLIGFIALNPSEQQDGVVLNLGYVFNADYRGQGYATEGCRAVIDYTYGELGAGGLVTHTAAANAPSCQLARRLGMRETGRDTASFRQTPDGAPIEFESVSFALSRGAWLAQRRAGMVVKGAD